MAISFPSSPVAGTSIYQGGRQWTYDGTTWNLVLGGSYELYWTHTGTGGETTLSGASDNGTTLTYPLGGENVYLNGVLLYRGQDYTATTGSTIVLANPLALADIVTVVSYPAVQMSSNNIAQTTEPTTYTPGMVWVNTAGNAQGLQLVRWKKTPNAGTTVLSGLADDGTTTLAYTAGYEEVYINGILIVKGVDYTATNGTSITLTQATVTGDTVEVFNTITMGVTNTYTQSQSDARYLQPAGYGNDGQVPVSSYGATGGYVWQNQYVAGKNFIINGDFRINQRGFSSFTGTPSGTTFSFDRWGIAGTTSGNSYSAQTFTPGSPVALGYESINYIQVTSVGQSSSTDYCEIFQRIEDVRTLAGKTVTVSFWAKASSGTPKVGVCFEQLFNSASTNTQTAIGQVSLTTSWVRYTITGTLPSITGKTIGDPGSSTQLHLLTSCGSGLSQYGGSMGTQNTTISFWGVQIETGSVATPFTTATGTIQGELAACQRYYYQLNLSGNPALSFTYIGNSTMQALITFPVTMRAAPAGSSSVNAFTTSGTPTGNQVYLNAYFVGNLSGTYNTVTVYGGTPNTGTVSLYSWTSPTTGIPYGIGGGSTAYFAFSAEL